MKSQPFYLPSKPSPAVRALRACGFSPLEHRHEKENRIMTVHTLPKIKADFQRVVRLRNQSVASCLELAPMQFVEREDRTPSDEKANATA